MVILGRLLVVFTVVVCSLTLSAQEPDSTFWVPNGQVNSLLIHDTTVILGGDFDQVSPVNGAFVRIDTTNPVIDPAFPKVFGTVYTTAIDRTGYVYLGGQFNRVGNQSVANLCRLKPDGTFDHSFIPTVIGVVYCLEVNDTALYLGGAFSHINGEERNNFGAINLSTLTTHVCNPNVNGPVYSMVPDHLSNVMVIGGDFSEVDNFPHPFVARMEMAFGNVSTWNAIPNVNGPVFDLHIEDVWLYMAGEFTHFSSYARRGIAKLLLSNGTLWQPADALINGPVYTMLFTDSSIYVGGKFSSAGGEVRNNIACLSSNLVLREWWDVNANGEVRVIYPLDKTRLFVGGDYSEIAGDTCGGAAIIYKATLTARNWNPAFNDVVYTAVCDTFLRLYVGGDFYGAGSVARNNLCAISLNTGRVTDWVPETDSMIFTMALDGDSLYLSGEFTAVNGIPRLRLAAIDLETNTLLPFNPGVNGLVRSFALTDSFVYVGGNFTTLNGEPRSNIGRLDKATMQADDWDPVCYGTVNSVIVTPQWIYVAGYFSSIGSYPRQNVARVHPQTGIADLFWICEANGGVYHAALFQNNLAIGGWFNQVNGQDAFQFALIDTGTTVQLAPVTFSSDGFVRTFTHYGDDFFIGGYFQVAANTFRPHLVAYDAGDHALDPWAPFPDAMPVTMEATFTQLFIGGSMLVTGGRFHPNFQVLPVQWVTSTNEIVSAESSVHVYPNPANNFITVNTGSGYSDYFLTDISGNILQAGVITERDFQLSLSSYAAGVYLLRLYGSDQPELNQRIIKY